MKKIRNRWKSYCYGFVQYDTYFNPKEQNIRRLVKEVFDILRNLLIVGALKFIALKTESVLIDYIASIALGIIFAYFYSYMMNWYVRPFRSAKDSGWLVITNWLISLVLLGLAYAVVTILIGAVVAELAKGQAR